MQESNPYLHLLNKDSKQKIDPVSTSDASQNPYISLIDKLPQQQEPESLMGKVHRNVARSLARATETVVGLPGDIASLPKKLAKYSMEKLTGKEHPEFDQANEILKYAIPGLNLPTSNEVRQGLEKIGGEYLKPQNKKEEFSDNIVSDLTSLLVPVKGKIPFAKSLGIAIGSNIAEKGAELLGAEEGGQAATKIGSTFLLSMINPKGAVKYADDLYKKAKSVLPNKAITPAFELHNDARKMLADLSKGGSADYKTAAQTKLKEIQKKITNGVIPVDELTEFKISVNNARSKLFSDFTIDKSTKAKAKRNLDGVSKILDKTIDQYAKTNPQWGKYYKDANESFSAITQSQKVSKAIGKLIKKNPHLSAVALGAKLFFVPHSAPALATGYGALKTGELMARIAKSPVLREYYQDAAKAAIKDDSALIIKNLNKLDAGLKKEEKDYSPVSKSK